MGSSLGGGTPALARIFSLRETRHQTTLLDKPEHVESIHRSDSQSKAPLVTELVAETRIDSPHGAGNASPGEAARLECGIEPGGLGPPRAFFASPRPEAISRQVQAQAAQLAEHLRTRQQELDYREAELNAWAAQLERDTRAARLWLEERNAEFEDTVSPAENILVQEDAIRRMAEALAGGSGSWPSPKRNRKRNARPCNSSTNSWWPTESVWTKSRKRSGSGWQQTRFAWRPRWSSRRREVEQRGEQADLAHAALERFRAELGRMNRGTLEIRRARRNCGPSSPARPRGPP